LLLLSALLETHECLIKQRISIRHRKRCNQTIPGYQEAGGRAKPKLFRMGKSVHDLHQARGRFAEYIRLMFLGFDRKGDQRCWRRADETPGGCKGRVEILPNRSTAQRGGGSLERSC